MKITYIFSRQVIHTTEVLLLNFHHLNTTGMKW